MADPKSYRKFRGLVNVSKLEAEDKENTAKQHNALSALRVGEGTRPRQERKLFLNHPTFLAATGGAAPAKHRTIYNNKNSTKLPHIAGKPTRDEGDSAATDTATNEVYDNFGTVWDFYSAVFNWHSLDNQNQPLVGVVHLGKNYANAFYTSDYQLMAFGDGNANMGNFTKSLDVVGHELTHGIVDRTLDLNYVFQSGALNEHVADTFGLSIRQWKNKETIAAGYWLVGDGTFYGGPLRSFRDPHEVKRNWQPSNMSEFVSWPKGTVPDSDENDMLGVHSNSGIPNHAFYLLCSELSRLGKSTHSWDLATKVWWDTVTKKSFLTSDATFEQFAERTVEVAAAYNVQEQVKNAWTAVGVTPKK